MTSRRRAIHDGGPCAGLVACLGLASGSRLRLGLGRCNGLALTLGSRNGLALTLGSRNRLVLPNGLARGNRLPLRDRLTLTIALGSCHRLGPI